LFAISPRNTHCAELQSDQNPRPTTDSICRFSQKCFPNCDDRTSWPRRVKVRCEARLSHQRHPVRRRDRNSEGTLGGWLTSFRGTSTAQVSDTLRSVGGAYFWSSPRASGLTPKFISGHVEEFEPICLTFLFQYHALQLLSYDPTTQMSYLNGDSEHGVKSSTTEFGTPGCCSTEDTVRQSPG